jgi:septal ring factor EnvC (AmiA/AmiB activator)
MHRPADDDRDWTHWPGRGPGDERPRGRLRSLFSPTDSEAEALEAVIEERGRELEQRAAALASVIADLEAREASVQAQLASAQTLLRDGSAELDERHAELTDLAQELAEREQALAAREAALDERRRELGAVELLRASVERREAVLARREAELEQQAAELTDAKASTAAHDHGPSTARTDAHLVVVPGDGYRLGERPGPPPAPGELVALDGTVYRVTRLGPSPLPRDDRRCAFLESAS